MKFELKKVKTAVVIGGGHGIGLALVKEILSKSDQSKVFVTYNNEQKAAPLFEFAKDNSDKVFTFKMNPTKEIELFNFKSSVEKSVEQIELLINSVGFLHTDTVSPEKSLRDVESENLLQYFEVNSLPHLLIGKVFHSLFRHKDLSCIVAVSAKVGSIEDNAMGGWYGYRASKAALNMFVKGISVEYSRRGCNSISLAVHPGTTVTELSKPFIKRTNYILHEPRETALNILNVIEGKSKEETGSFLSWDGSAIPW